MVAAIVLPIVLVAILTVLAIAIGGEEERIVNRHRKCKKCGGRGEVIDRRVYPAPAASEQEVYEYECGKCGNRWLLHVV